MGHGRQILIATAAALWALAPAEAWADGGTAAARSAAAAFVFSNQATQNAIVKAMDDDLLTQRRRAESLAAQLSSARVQLASAQASRAKAAQLQAQLDQLNGETAAAQEQFATALAAKDTAYARELAVLRDAADTILATPEGVRLLELANAGDWQGAKALEPSLRAARQKQHDREDAAEERALAVLALDAADKGHELTSAVIARFVETTRLDPGHYDDWMSLADLYSRVNDLADAEHAAGMAMQTAANDGERAHADLFSGQIAAEAGDQARALASDHAALEVIGAWLAREPASLDAVRARIGALDLEAETLQAQGDLQGAMAALRQLGAAYVVVLRSGHASQRDVDQAVRPVADIALILLQLRRNAEALAMAVGQIEIQRSLVASRPDDLQLRLDLALLLVIKGDALEAQKDAAGARSADEEALALDQAVAARDPSLVDAAAATSTALGRLGRIQLMQGDAAGAAARFEQELKLRRALAADDPRSEEHPQAIVIADGELAAAQTQAGQGAAAIAASQDAIQIARTLVAKDPSSATDRALLADAEERAAAMSAHASGKDPP